MRIQGRVRRREKPSSQAETPRQLVRRVLNGLELPDNGAMVRLGVDFLRLNEAISLRSIGRIAASREQQLVRSLSMLHVRPHEGVSIMEIGCLYGVASVQLYEAAAALGLRCTLTVIDPLNGYYGEGENDPVLNVIPSLRHVQRNFQIAGIPTSDLMVCQIASNELKARELLQRPQDYILIDGDHSQEAVQEDLVLSSSVLAHGGVLVIDDFGTQAWPGVELGVQAFLASSSQVWRRLVVEETLVLIRE